MEQWNYSLAYHTDQGSTAHVNQDSLCLHMADTVIGRVAMASVCDGMGGLTQGEYASGLVVQAFSKWFEQDLPLMLQDGFSRYRLYQQWHECLNACNDSLLKSGMTSGTTTVVVLFAQGQYYLLHIGDSRLYEISDRAVQVTSDHSLVANKVASGMISKEEAVCDPQRNILLRCVGVNEELNPDFLTGPVRRGARYLLLTDGCYHTVGEEELGRIFSNPLSSSGELTQACRYLVQENMRRGETDNLTALVVSVK